MTAVQSHAGEQSEVNSLHNDNACDAFKRIINLTSLSFVSEQPMIEDDMTKRTMGQITPVAIQFDTVKQPVDGAGNESD